MGNTLLSQWNKLSNNENNNKNNKDNTVSKPVENSNIHHSNIIINPNETVTHKKSDLFDKILSGKKPQNPSVKENSSVFNKTHVSQQQGIPPVSTTNTNNSTHNLNVISQHHSESNSRIINKTHDKWLPSSSSSLSSSITMNEPNYPEETSNSSLNLDISNFMGSSNPVKRVANYDYLSSKRFKPNSTEDLNYSLNNISYSQATKKPIVPILKKSAMKKGKTKKRVTFKPDGTIKQYRMIYDDGRDLYLRNKSISPKENNLLPSPNYLKFMEIPCFYHRTISKEEEVNERNISKKLKTLDYILGKEPLNSPRETELTKIQKGPNIIELHKTTKRIPQWTKDIFIRRIRKKIAFNQYTKSLNWNDYQILLNLLQRNDTNQRLDKFFTKINNTKIPSTVDPVEFLYKKLKANGFIK